VVRSFCLVLLLTVIPSWSLAQTPSEIEQGKKVYAANKCQMCHSIEGQGNKKGPLDGVGKRRSTAEIREWIVDAPAMTAKTKAERKPLMKSYPNIAKTDLDALVAYMQSLK
jgi:cytochrome c2